jgi:transcriptional regulator with XRE-family HTH domain
MDMHQQLRAAIVGCGLSQRQLAKEAGITHSQLSRYLRGERDLYLEAVTRLCRVLGLELRPAASETPAKKKGK